MQYMLSAPICTAYVNIPRIADIRSRSKSVFIQYSNQTLAIYLVCCHLCLQCCHLARVFFVGERVRLLASSWEQH